MENANRNSTAASELMEGPALSCLTARAAGALLVLSFAAVRRTPFLELFFFCAKAPTSGFQGNDRISDRAFSARNGTR